MLGADAAAIATAEDREQFKAAMIGIGLDVPASGSAHSLDEASRGRRRRSGCRRSSARRTSSAGAAPASPTTRRGVPPPRRGRAGGEPDQRDPHRAVDRRVEGVRARGDARPRRQLRDHLLDRERRPDGRAHRRLDHRRSGADAERRRVPGDAQRRLRLHPSRRGRDRWVERAVRPRSRNRPPGDHRDEPAGVAIVGAGVQGDRVPDRQDRHQARRRLHPRRDRERHHPNDAGVLRAVDRLRRDEGAALGVREAARDERRARHADAVRRRGDGDRADLPGEPAEGAALARAGPSRTQRRPRRAAARRAIDGRAAGGPRHARRPSASSRSPSCSAAGSPSSRSTPPAASTRGSSTRSPGSSRSGPLLDEVGGVDAMDRRIVATGEAARVQRRPARPSLAHRHRRRALGARGGRRRADVQDGRHVRRRVRRPRRRTTTRRGRTRTRFGRQTGPGS